MKPVLALITFLALACFAETLMVQYCLDHIKKLEARVEKLEDGVQKLEHPAHQWIIK